MSYLYTYGQEHPELYPEAEAQGSQPGIEATRDAAEGILGLTLQYYVVIDMQGFAQLIDALGGVDIEVADVRIPIGGDNEQRGRRVDGRSSRAAAHDGYPRSGTAARDTAPPAATTSGWRVSDRCKELLRPVRSRRTCSRSSRVAAAGADRP